MKERSFILLHPFFLTNLFILLVNDIILKYQYSNWLTGKLSDFSGLIVLSLFLTVFFKNRLMIILACSIFFIWWKSPLSQSVIEIMNSSLNIPVRRVIDYTDLTSIVVLPCVYFIKPGSYRIPFRDLAIKGVGILSLFAFCNTSPIRHNLYSGNRGNEIWFRRSYFNTRDEQSILDKLNRLNIPYYREYYKWYPVYESELFYKIHRDDSTRFIPINNSTDSALYVRARFPDGFYVIPMYVFKGDTLRNLEFTIISSNKKNAHSLLFNSFQTIDSDLFKEYQSPKKIRMLNRHFKEIFEKN